MFYLFLLALTIFRVAYSGWLELSLDEAYYWTWSNHLDLSYYDHPPMVAYLAAATTIFSESERWLRLGAVLCGSVITWITYLMAADIFNDKRAGFASAILLNLAPIFTIGTIAITPDAPLCLFWMVTLYYGYKIIETQKRAYWYALGASFGLALLSKYNAALFAPAFLAFLVFSRENRHWLFRREPYLAFALSMIIFSPVIYWNYERDWISFGFQLSHGFTRDPGNILANVGEFWGVQIPSFGMLLFFFIITASVGIGRIGLRDRREEFVYLSFMPAGLLLFFTFNSFRTRMEGNWSIVAYFAAIVATPGYLSIIKNRMDDSRARLTRNAYIFSLSLAAVMLVYAHIQIVEPVLPMPQKHEVSRRVFGWKKLAAESDTRLSSLGDGAFIVANRYQISTLLTYYTKNHRQAYITNGKNRFGYLGPIDHLEGKNALYVTESNRVNIGPMKLFFDKVEEAGSIRIERHGLLIREFVFFKCYNYHGGLIEI